MKRVWTLYISGSLLALTMASNPGATEEAAPAEILNALEQLLPGVSPDSVHATAIEGVYEVVLGPHVVYMSGDGKYMFRGDLIEVTTKVNLTEKTRTKARLDAISSLGEANMVVFGPEEAKHTITVFTDVECGYCQKMHSEMAEYNDLGIKVRYVAFPRAGIGSRAYDTMVSVWCSDDRKAAMTQAKSGHGVEARVCTNPVSDQYAMGQLLGVNGTPTIITDKGGLVPGYIPPKRLAVILDAG